MLIAHTITGLMILGLDEENIRRLKEGQPILKSLAQFGGHDDILIVYGETIDAIRNQLEKNMGPLPDTSGTPKLNG